jgi:hypothetical protein
MEIHQVLMKGGFRTQVDQRESKPRTRVITECLLQWYIKNYGRGQPVRGSQSNCELQALHSGTWGTKNIGMRIYK